MKSLKHLFFYLINPRAGTWKFSDSNERISPRKVPWKGILNPPLILGAIILTGLVILVWFGPNLASYDPYLTSRSRPSYYDREKNILVKPPFTPAPEYPLGTDLYGNDLLSLIFFGARVTLISCLYITAGRVFLGLFLGGMAGLREGSWWDHLIMRLGVVLSSIPLLLSAMLMILALNIRKGVWVFVVSLSVLGWTEISQQVRAEVIRIKGMLYVEAAEALGMNKIQILIRHALPNLLSHLVSLSFLEMGSILLIMAELAFLEIYVGGVSLFIFEQSIKPLKYVPVVVLLTKVPEWGALVAQGTPYLRGYPLMALGPAAAFFISILGLNAFGEGLRQIFVRWPISTAFLLKKRMLLFAAGFVGLSLMIFRMTNASVSYQKLAESIQEDRLMRVFEELKSCDDFAREGEENRLMAFVTERFEDFGLNEGYSEIVVPTYYYPAQTTVVKPLEEPELIIGNGDVFLFQEDFAFLSEGCAGGGSGQGQITLFGGKIDDLNRGEGNQWSGKIILTLEDFYSSDFVQKAASQGVEGILVAAQDQTALTSQFELSSDEEANHCPVNSIPVFLITEAAASLIMDQAGLDWEETITATELEDLVLDLVVQAEMNLSLTEPETVSVPNMIGFIGGFDLEHAGEILVVYTSFDGLGLTAYGQEGVPEADLAKIALLLEILHTWDDYQLDPRRSVQFVIWGGEGLVGPTVDMITGVLEKNRMAANVPTISIEPALWLEISDLRNDAETLSFSEDSTDFLVELFQKAARAGGIKIAGPGEADRLIKIDLPGLFLGEMNHRAPAVKADISDYTRQGVVINRVLIQILRDMEIREDSQ